MSDVIEVRSHRAASTRIPRRKATALRLVLAGLFAVILLGAAQATGLWSPGVVPAILGFATAITIIVAVALGWERQVDAAESAGLVKHHDQHPVEGPSRSTGAGDFPA